MRNGQIASREDAEAILSPFKPLLTAAISGSFEDYATVLWESPNATAGLTAYTRWRFIHDRTVHRLAVAEASGDHPGLRLTKIRGLYVVIVNDVLMLKLKKLNARLRSRNIPTNQTSAFDHQGQLLPEGAGVLTNATSGYVTDALGSEVVRAVVVCWDGPEKRWEVDLMESESEGGLVVTIPASPAPDPSRTRIVAEQPAKDERQAE